MATPPCPQSLNTQTNTYVHFKMHSTLPLYFLPVYAETSKQKNVKTHAEETKQ